MPFQYPGNGLWEGGLWNAVHRTRILQPGATPERLSCGNHGSPGPLQTRTPGCRDGVRGHRSKSSGLREAGNTGTQLAICGAAHTLDPEGWSVVPIYYPGMDGDERKNPGRMVAVVFGGGSRNGPESWAVLQLCGVPGGWAPSRSVQSCKACLIRLQVKISHGQVGAQK